MCGRESESESQCLAKPRDDRLLGDRHSSSQPEQAVELAAGDDGAEVGAAGNGPTRSCGEEACVCDVALWGPRMRDPGFRDTYRGLQPAACRPRSSAGTSR